MAKKLALILLLTISTSGCGILLLDVPIRVPIKGQEQFVNKKFKTKKDMYIVKYIGEAGYYMYAQAEPANVESIVVVPEGSILIGSHITRLNGWPNGTFYHYVAKLENWEIFQSKFVAQTKMDTKLFYPLNSEFFISLE